MGGGGWGWGWGGSGWRASVAASSLAVPWSSDCCCQGLGGGLPSRCATSISSRLMGGSSSILSFSCVNNFVSRAPLLSSGRPNTLMEPVRPCCSRSSYLIVKSETYCVRLSMVVSLSAICIPRAKLISLACLMASSRGPQLVSEPSSAVQQHTPVGIPA